ncbi:unnamed protein product [Litomosoides sigmodontis]|uniref:Uncharacterized protein n=1 Tax=Litomosoides sigmodontis TaxID=42156 RepID=A0A3P6TPA3_LITSI|nr:unnamed protein product [Litomosoides sigmodontis]
MNVGVSREAKNDSNLQCEYPVGNGEQAELMASLWLLVKLTWLGGDSRSRRRVLHGEVGPLHFVGSD